MANPCLLCRISQHEIPFEIMLEDEYVIAFDVPDGHPEKRAPVHFLVIPREHIPSSNDLHAHHEATLGRMWTVAARLAKDKSVSESGFRLVSNTGADAHQTEFHLHLHCVGGRDLGAGEWTSPWTPS